MRIAALVAEMSRRCHFAVDSGVVYKVVLGSMTFVAHSLAHNLDLFHLVAHTVC